MLTSARLGIGMAAALVAGASCEISVPGTVDPGPNFTVPTMTFNPNYFYCVVEPQIILGGLTGTPCGDNGSHGCHYSDKVPGMVLQQHSPVACSGSGVTAAPIAAVPEGTAPALNYTSVSPNMNVMYTDANIYIWPTSTAMHPVMVYSPTDAKVVSILMTWATLP